MGTILLLEDEENVNRGIAFTLEREGHTVLPCRSMTEADQRLAGCLPDMAICDITLPDGDGLDFVRRLREMGGVYILCLTALDGEMDFCLGYEAGADDYMAKPFSLSVLTMKVRAFFQRAEKKEKGEQQRSGELCVSFDKMTASVRGREISLTKNEWKLLKMFLRNAGHILSKEQILERLFDVDGDFVDENTVAVNIRRLREKIEADPAKPEYIKNIRGAGYIWTKACE